MTAIIWFRRDLRIEDNPAFAAACNANKSVIPLYIHDKGLSLALGEAQKWWLHHSLKSLDKLLNLKGLRLCLKNGDPLSVLKDLIKKYHVNQVYWNISIEPEQRAQDKKIREMLTSENIKINTYSGSLLIDPKTIRTQQDEYYKVFTPFWRQCLQQLSILEKHIVSHWPDSPDAKKDNLNDWNLLPQKTNWAKEFELKWRPGQDGAQIKLENFIENHLNDYDRQRDIPTAEATSYLAPHLHFGEISSWQIWRTIEELKRNPQRNIKAIERFCSELGWREFSHYLLYHFPDLPHANFRSKFDAFPWQNNKDNLTKWQKGLTGYPVVDAGMRELWRTGYMHNRIRMITASFLTKDLLIDWRLGAKWFFYTLLDANLANNSANWQWVAGSGADAAPYFRIFNPVLQGEKFDPNGDYIRKWVPELAALPAKWIHKPWQAPRGALSVKIGKDYPEPIVEHGKAREKALNIYKTLKD